MVVVGNGCVLGGGNGVIVVGRVMSERQWGFVLVVEDVHVIFCEWRNGGVRRMVGSGECRLLSSLVLLLCVFGRSFFSGVSAIEVGDKFWGMFQMLHGFPGAVACGKTFP